MIRNITFVMVMLTGLLSAAFTQAAVTPDEALSMLMKGNHKFIEGNFRNLEKQSSLEVRQQVATGQKPYAVVLTCSDSRVSPEILFDKGLGEIFVVRVAGNVVSPLELGSIEYAVEHLGSSLIMVLGHERCGAVTAAYDAHITGTLPGGNIGSLIQAIEPAVTEVLALNPSGSKEEIVEACILENIRNVAVSIEEDSTVLKEAADQGKIKIVTARYDLDDGIVNLLGSDLNKEAVEKTLTLSIITKPLKKPLSPTAANFNLVTSVPQGSTTADLQSAITNLPAWITITNLPKISKTTGTVVLQIAANVAYLERQATIYAGGNAFDIRQAGLPCPIPSLSQATATMPVIGGISAAITVSLPDGCGWDIIIPATSAWLSASPTSGSGNGSFSLSANANNTSKDLNAKPTVLTKNGKKAKVTVLQGNAISQYAGTYQGMFTGNGAGTSTGSFTATISKTGVGTALITTFNKTQRTQVGKIDAAGVIWAEGGQCGQVTLTTVGNNNVNAHITFYLYMGEGYIKADGDRI